MSEVFVRFLDIISTNFPLFILFLVFLAGYWFASMDFKPRPIAINEDCSLYPSFNTMPEIKKKALSNKQLGIDDIRNIGNAPMEIQKEKKMENRIKSHSADFPEDTANIIKGWLTDK